MKHAVRLDPLLNSGTKKHVARLYGPPHKKDTIKEVEVWSYRYPYDEVVWASSSYYYEGYYGGRYGHGYPRYGMYEAYPFYYPPQTYLRTRSYELLFEFDAGGVLRHWQFLCQ